MRATWSSFVFAVLFIGTLKVFAINGGVSGGGGYVINPASPQGPQSVLVTRHLIHKSVQDLEDVVKVKKIKWKKGRSDTNMQAIYDKLFQFPHRDLVAAAENTKILIEDQQPCFTYEGLPVDGSIHSKPGTVCVSAKTISEKVSYEDTSRQALALTLHELSELVGLDEDEAVLFQTEILKEF